MFKKIFELFKTDNQPPARESIDTKRIVQQIRNNEEEDRPSGRKIYSFDFKNYHINLDREITGQYRISVFLGNHKVYGFLITEEDIPDQQFVEIWDQIIRFLDENPSPKKMPDSEELTAHFFGNP